MFIPSTFKRPVSSWKALNLRKTLLMASSVRLKPLNCSRLPCVYAQETLMLAYQQKESTARAASIMENTNLSKQQQVSEIMRQMLTQAQTAGQYFTNDQIKEMTRKVSAEVDLVHQQTQNQRYGSSHIGATAKDISNVVTDAASGVVDIFHGIDKAVADTWNNFWKDGKADGIGSNLSRK